jgi:hypothetical protein
MSTDVHRLVSCLARLYNERNPYSGDGKSRSCYLKTDIRALRGPHMAFPGLSMLDSGYGNGRNPGRDGGNIGERTYDQFAIM